MCYWLFIFWMNNILHARGEISFIFVISQYSIYRTKKKKDITIQDFLIYCSRSLWPCKIDTIVFNSTLASFKKKLTTHSWILVFSVSPHIRIICLNNVSSIHICIYSFSRLFSFFPIGCHYFLSLWLLCFLSPMATWHVPNHWGFLAWYTY